MAVRSVKLKIHIKLADGKRTYADPVYEVKGRLKPLFAWVNNKQEHHPEGRYVLRYGDKWQFVGQQVDEVWATKQRLEEELAEAAACPVPQPTPVAINTGGPIILALLETWLGKLSTIDLETGKAPRATKTVDERRRIVSAFVRITGCVHLRAVVGADLVKYFAAVRQQANIDPKDPDRQERLRKRNVTVRNHYRCLRTFFKRHKIDLTDLLEEEQIPRCKGRVPTAYTEEEVARILALADPEFRLVLQFFCVTGFRKQEVANTRWEDVDLKTGIVSLGPHDGWDPKDKEARNVVLPDFMTAALTDYREKHKRDYLLFPSASGLVCDKNQWLGQLKTLAKRAGIKGRTDLHKFRATYATFLAKSGDVRIEEISQRLGHASTDTTKLYLERLGQHTDRAKRQSNEALAAFAFTKSA